MVKLVAFEPKNLNNLMNELIYEFPSPMELAYKEETDAQVILDSVRKEEKTFSKLSANEFNLIYQIAKLCTYDELNILKNIFKIRMTSTLFHTGWLYTQLNANDKGVVSLFEIACKWMKENRPYDFSLTLIGKTGLPWEEIYKKAENMLHKDKLSVDEFCQRYNILSNSIFYRQLKLLYFSTCGKNELRQNEAQIAQLIATASNEFLRPALINYSTLISYDEMSLLFKEAIIKRLSTEKNDDFIGLSPNIIAQIRKHRYGTILDQCTNNNTAKLSVYKSIAGKINNIEYFPNGIYTIDFGSYIIVDNQDWQTSAFAYPPKIFSSLMDDWKSKQYQNDYWPAFQETELITARDVILGLNKGSVIKIEFNEFDILYTRDLLTNTRYI